MKRSVRGDGTTLARKLLLMFSLILVVFAGCGRPVGITTGVVKFSDGSPVSAGSIEFRRIDDKSRYASRIAPAGTFQPADQDGSIGLPPGTYDVVVVQIVLTDNLALENHTHGHTVPRPYADYHTSGLRVDVDEEVTTPLEIVLEIGDDG